MELVARLATKPRNCRTIQRSNASTAVKLRSPRATLKVPCSIKAAWHNIAVTARTQIRKINAANAKGTRRKGVGKSGKMGKNIPPSSSHTAQPKSTPHLGKPKAGQRLLKRCWTRYCKHGSSRITITTLARSAFHRASNPPELRNALPEEDVELGQ